MSARVLDKARLLPLERPFSDALPPDAQHVGNQLLGHDEFFSMESIEAQQEPAAQLLIAGVMSITDCRLRNLGNQGLGVA